jgi:hypothetical protein
MSVGVRETEWLQLTQLGLGKALDATNPHPWASKSSYQAKEVSLPITTFIHVYFQKHAQQRHVQDLLALYGCMIRGLCLVGEV